MGKWNKYRRKGGQTAEPAPFVSIRRNQVALNAHFVSIAHLEEMTHVSVFSDSDGFRVGLQFHSESTDEDTVALTNDGGGKKGRGRCTQIAGLMRENPWLAAIAENSDPKSRRFIPKWVSTDSMWVVNMCPSFENRVSDKSDIPSEAMGIYQYKRGDEIVYIGRGQIRSRLGSREREDWDFETIEYSIIADESQQAKWETFWLDRFVERNNKLPIYNRISGKRTNE